ARRRDLDLVEVLPASPAASAAVVVSSVSSSVAAASFGSMPSASKAARVARRVIFPLFLSCRQTVSSRLARTSLIRSFFRRLLSTFPAALPLSFGLTGKTQRSGRWHAAERTTS